MSAAGMIELTIDGKTVQVPPGTTVFDAARMNGITIPTLWPPAEPDARRSLSPLRRWIPARAFSELHASGCEPNMKVQTNSEKVLAARKTLLELLMSDHPSPCARQENPAIANWKRWRRKRASARPGSRAAPSPVATMILRSPSPSITTPASCVTAAFAAATKSKTISSSAVWAKAIQLVSPSI